MVDFTNSYFAGGLVAMSKYGNSAIKTLADLDGKKVTVQVGTKSVSYLRQNHPKVQLVEVEPIRRCSTSSRLAALARL